MRRFPLKKRGRWSKVAERYYRRYRETEEMMAEDLRRAMENRLIWTEWLSKIYGIDLLLAAEVIGGFEWALKPGETIATHFKVPSQMWAFAGLNVNPKTGKPPKRVGGKKLTFCAPLRSILIGRVGPSFVRQSSEKSSYRRFYVEAKKKEYAKLRRQGIKIVPASKLPVDKRGKRYEPEGIISEGHVHNRAVRLTVKLFVSHLWEKCRELEGLPAGPQAYAFQVLGHSLEVYIPPFQDKE